MADLAVVFVNYHSEAMIEPRVGRLAKAGLEAIVADNSGTYVGAAQRVRLGRNVGFGAACNAAVRALPQAVRWVCFHNPDVDADPGVIAELRLRLVDRRGAGVVAPTERDSGSLRRAGYHYPNALRELLLTALASRRSRTSSVRQGTASERGRRFGGGALLVVDRVAHEAIGGFDERYFMYGEDLDYWDRMQRAGRSAFFAPDLVVEHRSGTGSRLGMSDREILRWLGVELFVSHRSRAWRRYRMIHRCGVTRLPGTALNQRVSALWHSRLAPDEVLAALRPDLESGRLLATSA